jgi:hypothetical protein
VGSPYKEDIKTADSFDFKKTDHEQEFMDYFGSIIVQDGIDKKGMAIFNLPEDIKEIGILVRSMKNQFNTLVFYWKYLKIKIDANETKQYYFVSLKNGIEKIPIDSIKDIYNNINEYSTQKTYMGTASRKEQIGYIKIK